MALLPGPFSRLASATVSGIVSTVAQTFAGVKTFLALLVASAGIQVGALFNTNGGSAGDVVMKVGTSTADASVNAAAKLLSVRTGIGATEVEYIFARKSEVTFWGASVTKVKWDAGGANQWQMRASPTTNFSIGINDSAEYMKLRASDGFISADFGIAVGDGSLGSTASYVKIYAGLGRIDQWGFDSTGTAGAATINRPTGKSSVAAAQSSVVITNSQVTAASRIIITPMENGTNNAEFRMFKVTPAAGSFTVTLSSAASVAWPFCWEVSNIL